MIAEIIAIEAHLMRKNDLESSGLTFFPC
jgi:hypothetical protein